MIATAHRGLAALIATIGVALASSAAADQRYQIEACSGEKACAFVLDTESGEVRFCVPAGCRVLDAAEAVEKPSPFPFGAQMPELGAGQVAEPFPLGEMGTAEPGVRELLGNPGAAAGAPSPFPYAEPAPNAQ